MLLLLALIYLFAFVELKICVARSAPQSALEIWSRTYSS